MSYVLATIQLPIEMFENGQYEIYSDRVTIQIHPCDVLPEKNEYNNQDLLDQIFAMKKRDQNIEKDENEMVHLKKSRTPKKRQNLTFSNRSKSHRFTKHNYPSSNTSTADSHLSSTDLD